MNKQPNRLSRAGENFVAGSPVEFAYRPSRLTDEIELVVEASVTNGTGAAINIAKQFGGAGALIQNIQVIRRDEAPNPNTPQIPRTAAPLVDLPGWALRYGILTGGIYAPLISRAYFAYGGDLLSHGACDIIEPALAAAEATRVVRFIVRIPFRMWNALRPADVRLNADFVDSLEFKIQIAANLHGATINAGTIKVNEISSRARANWAVPTAQSGEFGQAVLEFTHYTIPAVASGDKRRVSTERGNLAWMLLALHSTDNGAYDGNGKPADALDISQIEELSFNWRGQRFIEMSGDQLRRHSYRGMRILLGDELGDDPLFNGGNNAGAETAPMNGAHGIYLPKNMAFFNPMAFDAADRWHLTNTIDLGQAQNAAEMQVKFGSGAIDDRTLHIAHCSALLSAQLQALARNADFMPPPIQQAGNDAAAAKIQSQIRAAQDARETGQTAG